MLLYTCRSCCAAEIFSVVPIAAVRMRNKVRLFEADWPAGFPLIATTQLAVDGKVEHGQVARAVPKLQLGPDVPRPQRRL